MHPEFVYIRCPRCERIYRTTAALCVDKLVALLPVLKMLTATCPYCETLAKVGESFVASPKLDTGGASQSAPRGH